MILGQIRLKLGVPIEKSTVPIEKRGYEMKKEGIPIGSSSDSIKKVVRLENCQYFLLSLGFYTEIALRIGSKGSLYSIKGKKGDISIHKKYKRHLN